MFSVLLTSLQTSLGQVFSKSFAVTCVLPIMLLIGASLMLAANLGGSAGSWALTASALLGPSTDLAWKLAFWLLTIISVSTIWSGMNGFLLEILEGKHLGLLASILYAGQWRQKVELDEKIRAYTFDLRELEGASSSALTPLAVQYEMKTRLRDARDKGKANQHPSYPKHWLEEISSFLQRKHAIRELWRVRWRQVTGQVNTLATIKPAVDAIADELKIGSSKPLAVHHVALLNAIDDSRERLHFELLRLVNLRQFAYPTVFNASRGETGLRVLAPTRLGNLTRTMRSYALDRYGLDLEIFWTRLQRALQKETSFNTTISDSKIQVDFLVSLFFMTVIFTIYWSVYCLWVQPEPRAFLGVAALGPVAARLLYLAACQNYLVFCDLMRSSVDHFRFDLLDELHLKRPPGNREEILLWRELGGWIGYGNDVDVTFKDQV